MDHRLLADALVVVHLAFIAFVIGGGACVLRWPRAAWAHLPALGWGVYAEATATICPLTPLENLWRQRAGEAGYPGGFVDHYLIPLIYPAGITPGVQVVLAALLLIVNAGVYAAAWRRHRRARDATGANAPT